MTYATIAAGVDPSSFFTGAEGLLRYGPLGLAGLLLVLVVIVLLLRAVQPSQERVLKLCLYVGAFCFVAALVAQYLTLKAESGRLAPDFSSQKEALDNVARTVDPSVRQLTEINQMALSDGCPGGAHGIPIPHGGDIASRSSSVMTNLANAKSAIEGVIRSLPNRNY
jgi:hypothetical protein